MQTASDRAASPWLRPEFARLLAILWVSGLALVFLIRYNAWLLPLQLAGLVSASLPGLHIGPHCREFWIGCGCDAACVAGIVFAALGLGATVANGLIQRRDVLGVLFALAAGFWLLAVIVLVVGAVSVTKVPHVFLALLCWLLPAPRKFVRDFQVSTEKIDGWAKLVFACVVLAAVLNLPGALAPPFEYDELEYHLGALADYQRDGRIMFLPHNFYSNLPQLAEMLYLLATTTTSDIAAKLLHWLFGVLGALAVYGVARRLWSSNAGLTAAALFYCTPFVQDLSQTARVDLATGFFATLAFGALLLWSDNRTEKNWVWLSALCAGAAVATKWPAIPVVVLPAIVFIAIATQSIRLPALFGLLSPVFVVPWLVKNWLLTGNPVYPLFAAWFPSPHWSAEQAAVFAARHYPKFGWEAVGQFFALLWNYSFVEARAVPLLLMTAPLLLLVRWAEPAAKRTAGLFAGAYAGWSCFTFRPWRFLFPAFGMAALAGAHALEKFGREPVARRVIRISVGVVLATSLAAMALSDFVDAEDPARVPPQVSFVQHALGQSTRDEFVARIGRGVLEPIVWMNHNLPNNAKVLYIAEARAYYAKHLVLWSTPFDQHPVAAMSRKAKTPGEMLAALRAEGITHVYWNLSELTRLQKGYDYDSTSGVHWSLIFDALKGHVNVVHASNHRFVYELTK